MGYWLLLLLLSGVIALGSFVLIYQAYGLRIRSEQERAGEDLLAGVLGVILLAVPCSLIAFVGHAFIDVNSEFDWVKTILSWVIVPPLYYYLLYRIALRFRFFRAYPLGYWAKLASSGVLISWALQALMMYELSTMS